MLTSPLPFTALILYALSGNFAELEDVRIDREEKNADELPDMESDPAA